MPNKIKHGIIFIIGYILSPLSWWNDLIINLPVAYIIASIFGLISKKLFMPIMIAAYWGTNVLGFFLMHHSLKNIIYNEAKDKKSVLKIILISFTYTILILVLAKTGFLKFPFDYFK
uniref:Uncharacterized protein n=1 Tax=candidate division WOR-3 bacterium TaxID=2052148 RepID=A0A7V3RGC4_UNCW3